jgi:hypothetical protein
MFIFLTFVAMAAKKQLLEQIDPDDSLQVS